MSIKHVSCTFITHITSYVSKDTMIVSDLSILSNYQHLLTNTCPGMFSVN